MKTPTNIEVQITPGNDTKASASWEMDGARFHVWFDVKTKEISRDFSIGRTAAKGRILYKNPLVARRDPGYFETRKLDADASKNAEVIALVFKKIEDKDLIAKAKADDAEKQRKQQEANAEYQRQERIKGAAMRLLAEVRAVAEGATRTEHCLALLRDLGESA